MSNVRKCMYRACYHNNNIENICLADKLTVSVTGVCETLMHCDEFICSECEHFDVCEKEKKAKYSAGR